MIYAELVIGLRKIEAQSYEVELRFTHPTSDTELAPARSLIHLDLEEFNALKAGPANDASYGSALTRSLFASPGGASPLHPGARGSAGRRLGPEGASVD